MRVRLLHLRAAARRERHVDAQDAVLVRRRGTLIHGGQQGVAAFLLR